jgi:hypothetical protein
MEGRPSAAIGWAANGRKDCRRARLFGNFAPAVLPEQCKRNRNGTLFAVWLGPYGVVQTFLDVMEGLS